jgi:hypothetical protein
MQEKLKELIEKSSLLEQTIKLFQHDLLKFQSEFKIVQINDSTKTIVELKYDKTDLDKIEFWEKLVTLPEPIMLSFYRYFNQINNEFSDTEITFTAKYSKASYKAMKSILWDIKYWLHHVLFEISTKSYYNSARIYVKYSELNYSNKILIKGYFKKLDEIIQRYEN